MSGKGRFIKNSLLFLVGTGLSRALSIIMLPLYTSQIPTADYGAYDISLTIITIASSIAYFELWSAVMRYMYDRSDDAGRASVVRSGFVLMCGSTALFIVLGWAVCSMLSLGHPGWVVAYGIASAASSYFGFVARGYGKSKEFTISGILSSVVVVGANLTLILALHLDYSALYISFVLGTFVQCAYLGRSIRLGALVAGGKVDRGLMKELLRFAAPLCLNTASYWLLSSASRLVFNYMCGDAASGVFSVGNKFGQIIVLATTCFTYAWQDLSFSASSRGANGAFFTAACRKYLLFLVAALALLLPLVKLVFPLFVLGEYGDAFSVVPLSLVVALVSGYSGFVGNIFYAIKETRTVGASTVAAGVVAVACAPASISLLGANGVNVSVLVGFLVNLLIRAVILRRKVGFSISPGACILSVVWIVGSSAAFFSPPSITALALVLSLAITATVFRDDLRIMLRRISSTVKGRVD